MNVSIAIAASTTGIAAGADNQGRPRIARGTPGPRFLGVLRVLTYVASGFSRMEATYTRSTSEGDLNVLTNYFDAVLSPVLDVNTYTRLSTDVPHRLLVRGRVMPAPKWLLLGIERRIKILKFQPWVGVRFNNALGQFLPEDVQNNTASPFFGTFYNAEPRRLRLQVRFER